MTLFSSFMKPAGGALPPLPEESDPALPLSSWLGLRGWLGGRSGGAFGSSLALLGVGVLDGMEGLLGGVGLFEAEGTGGVEAETEFEGRPSLGWSVGASFRGFLMED